METTGIRAARDIVESMGNKALFTYADDMEISVPESDRRNSLDKIACYYHSEQFTLSDLYIGYAISLYRYTIPKVVAGTIKALGNYWPQKNVPKNIDREALLSRIKKMCGMGMLRRFTFVVNGNNIVLYSTTPEFSKVIYQALKMSTDARPEKDMIPPIEILERAAASFVTSELMVSKFLTIFDFMPEFRDSEGRLTFNAKLTHEIGGEKFVTVVEPFFTRIDKKRFTAEEWEQFLFRKARALKSFADQITERENCKTQIIVICEDVDDFKKAGTIMCNIFLEQDLDKIYYTSEGALKSAEYNLTNSCVRVTSLKPGPNSILLPESVSAQMSYQFF